MSSTDFDSSRKHLVEHELLEIKDPRVLEVMRTVPRERFISERLQEFAYRDVALPIDCGQTISQPFMVALMAEMLRLQPSDRVLEIGTGSGYAAAVYSKLAKEVYSVERLDRLARTAQDRLDKMGYSNVHVLTADGTLGWSAHAPYDAIAVAAGGPTVPDSLLKQLAIGGRLLMPVGVHPDSQKMVLVTRKSTNEFQREESIRVRFVPLIGEEGWASDDANQHHDLPEANRQGTPRRSLPALIQDACESFTSIETADLNPLLDRVGQARIVLIGESSHGTSEFYRMRARITQALIQHKQFDFVAVEADWPDAYRIHDFVTHKERKEPHEWKAFARFPTWMWRNQEVLDFIHWLREFNLLQRHASHRVGFYGLDLYSMFTSIHCVLDYLERVDPESAEVARTRYGCLTPWEGDPATYGKAALTGRYHSCESDVVKMLQEISQRRFSQSLADGEELFDAQLNARLVADAEKYYRIMYYGASESWNHRDTHMFDVLKRLLKRYEAGSKCVIWAHNSHLGNSAATHFADEGQINLGQLCSETFGRDVYAIGQGTYSGTVAAASNWEGPMEVKQVRPALSGSYEHLMHLAEIQSFFLPLTQPIHRETPAALTSARLERAIGVIYRPETERQSHYFAASLPNQFDEWIWFDETRAIEPLTTKQATEHEPQHPFATFDE